jgi:HPr kinase/phosphorylase
MGNDSLIENHMASEVTREEGRALTVREFVAAPALAIELEVVGGHEGLDNLIRSSRIQKLGLALASSTSLIHPDRVQVFGSSELSFLGALDPVIRAGAINRLKSSRICCIVFTKNLEIPDDLIRLSNKEKIPLIRSSSISSVSIAKITGYLEKRLAPKITIHGVLLEIFGLGVLILGPSGIGKSECALELVLKGHRLVTDDYVEITRRGLDRLFGAGGKVLKHHMELRGLGIINIRELFGISATGASQNIDFAVRLERWNPETEYDRLGLEHSTIDFLGLSIPIIDMPVAPGRNVATLVEVAARIHLLRQRGHRPSKEVANGE